MSIADSRKTRTPHDLTHLIYQCGAVGRLTTIDCLPVIAGDSFQNEIVGSFKFSAMRRNLTLDPVVDVLSFYIPHRHIYGDDWVNFVKKGPSTSGSVNQLTAVDTVAFKDFGALGLNSVSGATDVSRDIPIWRRRGYYNIFNHYFKRPDDDDVPLSTPIGNGFAGRHLKNFWTAPLNPSADTANAEIDVSGGTASVIKLQQAAGAYAREQNLDFFAQRYRDANQAFGGGKVTIDADERPLLLKRDTFHASGYDVDGTGETSLGQYTGRVAFNFTHKIPRYFCNEHGAIWTVMMVRFQPVNTCENHYLSSQVPTYENMIGDELIVQNQAEPFSVDSQKYFNGFDNPTAGSFSVPHSQWYRTHPSVVNHRFTELQGYPFISKLPEAKPWTMRPDDYNQIFQTDQLLHWNIAARSNAMALRNLPTARESFMAS